MAKKPPKRPHPGPLPDAEEARSKQRLLLDEAGPATPIGLTPEQQQAIATRDVSVALSAGAGCGKTFVLTERFLSYLDPDDPNRLEPAQIGQLLAITFTDRAAREMRDRIRKKSFERLMAADEPRHAEYWAALGRALDSARISTIHSFCGALLRGHAVEAALDPGFTVLEQAQADTLLAELIDDVLRGLLAEGHAATLDLLAEFDLNELRDMVTRLVSRYRAADFEPWLERTPEYLVSVWAEFHRTAGVPAAVRRVATSPPAEAILRILQQCDPAHAEMKARRGFLLEALPALGARCLKPPDAAAAFAAIAERARVQGGGGAKVWPSPEIYEQFKDAATKLRDAIVKMTPFLEFDSQAALPAAASACQVLRLAARIATAYTEKKQQAGVLDFNDLLARAHRLLTDPEHAEMTRRLSAQIRLLLVDEFQDTDPLQVQIVSALCGESVGAGKLFLVGDHKQSIYRFRGARPRVFRELREAIPEKGRLPLTLNFRSQPAILNFVNALFCQELGEEYEPLRPSRVQVSPEPAVEFLWAPALHPREAKGELRHREADWIARRLRTMIDSQVPLVWDGKAAEADAPAARPVAPGDIAILFRALSDVEYYEEALRKYGLDHYLVGGHAFYAQQEVFDLLNLLRSLDSSIDEISLAGALRSPFFSLADETLYWLAQHEEGLSAGLFATSLSAQLSESERRRATFAAATLARLRERKDRLPIADLMNEALALTGYDAALLGEFLGQRKLANLRKLIEQARTFDRSGMFTLSDFIAQLSGFVAKQPDEALAATHPEATNVVRLMSIHQSKGLEFPVVVVPDMERTTHGQNAGVEFTPELGPMVRLPKDRDDERCLGGYELYAMVQQEEELAEIHRLLYVATTRAADYLILSSGVAKLGTPAGPWMQLLARRFDLVSGAKIGGAGPDDGAPAQARPLSREEGGQQQGAALVRVTASEPERPATVAAEPRKNLAKLVDDALELAAAGKGRVPMFTGTLPADATARRQYSFSRLSGELHRPTAPLPVGLLEDDSGGQPATDPLGLGTLVHAVLAELDLSAAPEPRQVKSLVRRLAAAHLQTDNGEMADAIAMIERFQKSPRAADLAAAAESYAELEFMLAWPPEDAAPGAMFLSGFIDRLYRDAAGRWHVLDFKTNRVTADRLAEVAAGYEMQMLVYALAAERVLKSPPAGLTLHFLRGGLEHSFAWDDRARRRVREMIDQSIAAVRAPHLSAATR